MIKKRIVKIVLATLSFITLKLNAFGQTQYDYYDDNVVGGTSSTLNGIIIIVGIIVLAIIISLVIGGTLKFFYWINPNEAPNYTRNSEKDKQTTKEMAAIDKKKSVLDVEKTKGNTYLEHDFLDESVDTKIFPKSRADREEQHTWYDPVIVQDEFEEVMDWEERTQEKEEFDVPYLIEENNELPLAFNCLDHSPVQIFDSNYFKDRKEEHNKFIQKFIKEQEEKFFPVGSIEETLANLSREPLVDLGLSVKWSSKNLGAKEIYDLGYKFRWGCLDYIDNYNPEKISEYSQIPYNEDIEKYEQDISNNKDYDAATNLSKGELRIPTPAEWAELLAKCDWTYLEVNKYKGFIVTGPSGGSIYLPLSYSSFVNCMHIVMMTVEEAYMTSEPDMSSKPELEKIFGFEGYSLRFSIINTGNKTENFEKKVKSYSKQKYSPIRGVESI